MSENLKTVIGARVKAARKSAGLTQARVADAVDRTVEAISNLERGKSLPSLDLLQQIAELTGCPLSELISSPVEGGAVRERAALETRLALAGRSRWKSSGSRLSR